MKTVLKSKESAPKTFGELVTWAYETAPSRGAAVQLLEHLLRSGTVMFKSCRH